MRVLEISQLSLRYADTRIQARPRRARLAAAIAEQGQLSPVLVHPSDAQFVLVDGYARVGALQDLGQDFVSALVLEMSPTEALLTGHRLQGGRRRSAIEEAWLLQTLVDEHGVRPRDLARQLERSASWVSRRRALVEVLPQSVQDAIRRAELCPQAAMKSLVPLARANAEHCERLVTALSGEALSVRELDQIYRAWRDAEAPVRERIVQHPKLFLRSRQAAAAAVPPSPSVCEELRALRRLVERVTARIDPSSTAEDLDRLRDAWSGACHAFSGLQARMETLHA